MSTELSEETLTPAFIASSASIDLFCDALWLEHGLAKNTLEAYRRDLKLFAEWLAKTRAGSIDSVTEADLNTAVSSQLMRIQAQIYEIKKQGLDEIINNKLLTKEAKKRGVTVDQLMKTEVAEKVGNIPDQEITDFYNQNKARMGGRTLEEVKGPIKQQMFARKASVYQENFLSRLKDAVALKINLEAPKVDVSVDDDPMKGNKNATVTIIDPVADAIYTLIPGSKTAMRVSMSTITNAPAPPSPPAMLLLPEQDLGTKDIDGIAAVGHRTITTIPAGQVGNDRPIEIIDERWESPTLKVLLRSLHRDPRTGDVEYVLTKISRAEPPASLFTVPAGYTIRSVDQIRSNPQPTTSSRRLK